MREREPATQTMKISDVKSQFSSLVDRVARGEARVLVEKAGTPVAAVVSLNDLARLEQLDREWEATTQAIARFSQAFADVPVVELEAKIEEIIAENRAKDAAERRTA
jgi:prevent-host-death family protein